MVQQRVWLCAARQKSHGTHCNFGMANIGDVSGAHEVIHNASYCLDSISPQLQAELDTTRSQLSDSNAEATVATQQLRSVEAARQVSELGHQTQAERARDLQQRVEQLSETLDAERGIWTDEKQELKV